MSRWLGTLGCILFFVSCAMHDEDEQLIKFSDETFLVKDAERIQICAILKNDQGWAIDTVIRFVGRDFFSQNNSFHQRFLSLRKGERYQWKLSNDWKDPFLVSPISYHFLDMEILCTWTVKEWLGALSQMAQQSTFPEDSIVSWVGYNWIGDQAWEVKKDGLLWRWIRHGQGNQIDTSVMVSTWISTHHLNGDMIGEPLNMAAKLGHQQQWVPAVQWALPYLKEGDSIEIVSKSQWTYQDPSQLGLPPHTPLKFYLGVHLVH